MAIYQIDPSNKKKPVEWESVGQFVEARSLDSKAAGLLVMCLDGDLPSAFGYYWSRTNPAAERHARDQLAIRREAQALGMTTAEYMDAMDI